MERAKDYIADEQWARAIAELQAVAADPQEAEPRRGAVLAGAQRARNGGPQRRDPDASRASSGSFRRAAGCASARSLRVEIAQRLNRDDVLWAVVTPPPPPPRRAAAASRRRRRAGGATGAAGGSGAAAPARRRPPRPPATMPRRRAGHRARPRRCRRRAADASGALRLPAARAAPAAAGHARAAGDARCSAAGGRVFPPDAAIRPTPICDRGAERAARSAQRRVIPLLRDIALDGNNPDEARRAIIVLARSPRPEARRTVIEVARRGAEPVRLAAIREMGRFDGAGGDRRTDAGLFDRHDAARQAPDRVVARRAGRQRVAAAHRAGSNRIRPSATRRS